MFQDVWALVVESDAHQLMNVSAILRELGIHYKRNTSGTDVVGQADTMRPRPHFILLDLDLSGGDPLLICQAIRASASLSRTPVIGIGSPQWVKQRSQMQAAGFTSFISKPLPRRQFGLLIQRILAGQSVWQS